MTGILFTLESAALVASFEAKFFPLSSLDNRLQSYCLLLPVSIQGPWSSFKEPGQGYWVLTEWPQICEEFHSAVSCWLVAEEGVQQGWREIPCDVVAVKGEHWLCFADGLLSLDVFTLLGSCLLADGTEEAQYWLHSLYFSFYAGSNCS